MVVMVRDVKHDFGNFEWSGLVYKKCKACLQRGFAHFEYKLLRHFAYDIVYNNTYNDCYGEVRKT